MTRSAELHGFLPSVKLFQKIMCGRSCHLKRKKSSPFRMLNINVWFCSLEKKSCWNKSPSNEAMDKDTCLKANFSHWIWQLALSLGSEMELDGILLNAFDRFTPRPLCFRWQREDSIAEKEPSFVLIKIPDNKSSAQDNDFCLILCFLICWFFGRFQWNSRRYEKLSRLEQRLSLQIVINQYHYNVYFFNLESLGWNVSRDILNECESAF